MLTEKQKQALTVGIIFAVLLTTVVVVYKIYILGPSEAQAVTSIATADKDIAKYEKDIARFDKFINDDEERLAMQTKVENARRRLPSSIEEVDFFDIIRESARRTGTSFSEISPVDIRNQQGYREIPYDIVGSSRYHEFGQFLNLIECHPDRFLRVNSFSVTNNNKRPSLHPVELQISTFIFQD